MSETINDLRILAKQVRNASSQGENTAERVGHVMEGTLDLIEGASPDLSKYYTKQESDTLLLSKWTYDASRAASWDDASKDRHTHANKPALDLIVYDPVKNVWKFTGNAAFSGDVISYANLGDVDIPTIYEGLPIDNKTIKRDINGVLFAESATGGSFDESSMWTALGTSISSKLIAQRYLNLSGYATEAYVTEKIQGLGAVFNLKGTKTTPSDLPTTGNKVGDVWYVASESVGYIWITDEKGVLRWEKFGEPVDLSAYYTKTETNALLANKWTTDTVLISQWNDAYTLRHSHSNKAIIDGITNTLINNWNSASADAHKHANKPALDLIEYDSAKNVWKFTGNAAFSGDVISYANLGDVNIPSIYEGLPIDNVTIKRNSAGALYSLSGSGGDFDKAAMWSALALSTSEQINKSHLIDALSTYVLTTDSRLSDSRNAKDVYAWAKQPMKPTYSYYEIEGYLSSLKTDDIRNNNPSDFRKQSFTPFFLDGAKIGLSGSLDAIYIDSYMDVSPGKTNLLALSKINGEMYRMSVNQGAFLWDGVLVKMIDSLNWQSIIDGRYLPLSGGSLNNSLSVGGILLDFSSSYVRINGYFETKTNGLGLYNSAADARWFANNNGWNSDKQIIVLGDIVWNKGNDGDGSGLDADLWKGLQPNQTNVLSATKLQTPRSIWGQLYDGTGNVDGDLFTSGAVYASASLYAADAIYASGRIFTGYDAGVANSISCSNWFRSNGTTGWINNTYGGGIHMPDSSHVAIYGSKKFLISETSFDSFRTKGGIVAEGNTLQLGNIKLVVNPSAKTIRFEMLDGTPCNIVSTGDMIIYN